MGSTSPPNVAHIDGLCAMVYDAMNTSQQQRAAAEEELNQLLGEDFDSLVRVLIATDSAYTIMALSQAAVPAFRHVAKDLPQERQVLYMSGILEKVVTVTRIARGSSSQQQQLFSAVLGNLVQSLSRMAKLLVGAEDGECLLARRCMSVDPSLLGDPEAVTPSNAVELDVLATVVYEIQTYDASHRNSFMSFGAHRRASTAFRDGMLLDVFNYAVSLLRGMVNQVTSDGGLESLAAVVPREFVMAVVRIVRMVLNYDFMAIIVDETEELYVTQFPNEWKGTLTPELFEMLSTAHQRLGPECAVPLLEAITGLIGTRRSFYESGDMKTQWLNFFMEALIAVNSVNDGRLNNPAYNGVLARAIGRFTPPHGYADLMLCPSAQAFLTFAAEFTLVVLEIPFGSGGSYTTTTSLLQFWSRLAGSKRLALNEDDPPGADIEGFLPSMVEVFVKTRISSPDVDFDEEAAESISSQSDLLPGLVRLCPEQSINQVLAGASSIGAQSVASTPTTMIWGCYIFGAIVRQWFGDIRDKLVDLACGVLSFGIEIVRSYLQGSDRRDSHVENAVIYFLSQLQHVFSASRISPALTKVLEQTTSSKAQLYQFILQSLGSNMMSTALEPVTIRESINLIAEACRELPADELRVISSHLALPPVENLPFASNTVMYKLRTPLLKVMFNVYVPDNVTMQSLTDFLGHTEGLMRSAQEPLEIAGWLRDLRGVSAATAVGQPAFSEFLDWLAAHDDELSSLSKAPNVPPLILISFLKLLLQLVTPNFPTSKLNVPSMAHSAAGIHLLQFVSQHLRNLLMNTVECSQEMAAVERDEYNEGLWPSALKPVQIAFEIVRHCVSGEFCPFGAMAFYGDRSFDDLVLGIFGVAKRIPARFYSEFGKLGGSLQLLLRTMVESATISPFGKMENDLGFLIERAVAVVRNVDEQAIATSNAMTFLSFIGGLYPEVCRLENGGEDLHHPNAPSRAARSDKQAVAQLLLGQPALWEMLLLTAMRVVTTQDRGLHPASQTVFPMVSNNPSLWGVYHEHLMSTTPPNKQQRVSELMTQLTQQVSTSDNFFSSLVGYRMNMRAV